MSTSAETTRARQLQDRICSARYPLEPDAAQVFEQIKRVLLAGYREEQLRTPPHRVAKLLKLYPGPGPSRRPHAWEIVGGPRVKDFARQLPADELFERCDGALFNFALTLGQGREAPELLAYDFELRFPPAYAAMHRGPRFIRFDLNLPGHDNASHGMRCHVHPGHDDLQAPSALMTPSEIIELFLYRLMLPEKLRSK